MDFNKCLKEKDAKGGKCVALDWTTTKDFGFLTLTGPDGGEAAAKSLMLLSYERKVRVAGEIVKCNPVDDNTNRGKAPRAKAAQGGKGKGRGDGQKSGKTEQKAQGQSKAAAPIVDDDGFEVKQKGKKPKK